MVAISHTFAPCIAPAVFLGTQKGIPGVPSFDLYNLTADIEGYPSGSTVAASTLLELGYVLPRRLVPADLPTAESCPPVLVYREVVPHPRGGYTHAAPVDATQSTQRIYKGWWATRAAAESALSIYFF